MATKGSRIAAIAIVIAAAGWITSGYVGRNTPATARDTPPAPKETTPLFRVAFLPVEVKEHARRIVLSGRTEADRRVMAATRIPGTITRFPVRRGSVVNEGDIIAELSDDAREASVQQAQARLSQRKAELEARLRLIEQGSLPSLNRPQLEADLKQAEAQLALAETERAKGFVRAPVGGIVSDTRVEEGQQVPSGQSVAEIIAPDPMLAVVEIAERQLGGVKPGDGANVRLVTGQTAEGKVRFVSPKASQQTRTYRVDIAIPNPGGNIPDGVTAEVTLTLAAVPAASVPRSALTFSADGKLGVRIVDAESRARFVPVSVVEDGASELWVSGLENGARVIVQGQDFVGDGLAVEAVRAGAQG